MDTYVRFLYEFLSEFFAGLQTILTGFVEGIKQLFDIPGYIHLIKEYKNDFSVQEWVLVAIAVFAVAAILSEIIETSFWIEEMSCLIGVNAFSSIFFFS